MKKLLNSLIVIASIFALSLPVFAQSSGNIVLDTTGMWRTYYAFSQAVVVDGGKFQKVGIETNTKLPPADWMAADFDDAGWAKTSMPFSSWSHYIKPDQLQVGFMGSHSDSIAISVYCLRGKFNADPSRAGKLNLSLVYRGGVVVYMNGKEVARGNMPKDGKITVETPADAYPKDAYFNDKGAMLKGDGDLEKMQTRLRTLENIVIPRDTLRKGVNVLAIEIHRSALPKEVYEKAKTIRDDRDIMAYFFDSIGLVTAQLTGSGVTNNSVRPSKTQIWNSQPLACDYDTDWGDPNEPLKPIQLAGARNGSFSGKVVLGSTSSMKKIKAVITDLTGKNGGSIPAAEVQIRYAAAPIGYDDRRPAVLDNLLEVAPREVPVHAIKPSNTFRKIPGAPEAVPGAVLPVWITVNVPAEAKADDYEGELKITLDGGGPFNVPVRLRVYNYLLPEPKDFTAFSELIQSPETLAIVYKVPLWSEKHWKLIEKSVSFLGQLGVKTCYIPLICKTNMGNEESMVRWTKDKDKYKYDFTIMEKYLDLVEKYQGKVPIVCIYIWDIYVNAGEESLDMKLFTKEGSAALSEYAGKGPEVTFLNGTKTVGDFLPKYSDPKAKAAWKPLIDELKARLKKRGLEKSIMLGSFTDFQPVDVIIKFWQEVMPGAQWVKHAHMRGAYSVPGAVMGDGKTGFGYTGTVWDRSTLVDFYAKSDKSARGWKAKELSTFFARDLRNYDPLAIFRMITEICTFGEQRGFARLGADFWLLNNGGTVDSAGVIASDGRYPQSTWRNLNIRTSLLGCGPDSAVATQRFEMMREGVQESEARVAVEKAIDDGKLKSRLDKIITERNVSIYNAFYDNRVAFVGKKGGWSSYYWAASPQVKSGSLYYVISEWQERSADLYEAAADVTSKERNPAFSVSYRDLTKSASSGSKESFDKEAKIGVFTVKIEPNPFVPGDKPLSIKFQTEKLTLVTAGIYNDKKELIKKLATGEAHSKWEWNLIWDGRDDNGAYSKEGKYTAKINIGGKEGTVTVGIEKKSDKSGKSEKSGESE